MAPKADTKAQGSKKAGKVAAAVKSSVSRKVKKVRTNV
eukprot:CAMPEP_0115101038 /NCGR_PEP_ID=MMETSP0227-20121206/32956_1 /TAXON_ID=89957 /ORGANISM="Polarella glacialis, Strain CCMP 1383" /LENGTH=37 /DNA_ID= /DNA_START= /DNA_END= /DNA_ORIENTATION=